MAKTIKSGVSFPNQIFSTSFEEYHIYSSFLLFSEWKTFIQCFLDFVRGSKEEMFLFETLEQFDHRLSWPEGALRLQFGSFQKVIYSDSTLSDFEKYLDLRTLSGADFPLSICYFEVPNMCVLESFNLNWSIYFSPLDEIILIGLMNVSSPSFKKTFKENKILEEYYLPPDQLRELTNGFLSIKGQNDLKHRYFKVLIETYFPQYFDNYFQS